MAAGESRRGPSRYGMALKEWLTFKADSGLYPGLFWADEQKTRLVLAATPPSFPNYDYQRDGQHYDAYCELRHIPLPSGRSRLCQARGRLLGAVRKSKYFEEDKEFPTDQFPFTALVFRLRSSEEMSCPVCPRVCALRLELRNMRFAMLGRGMLHALSGPSVSDQERRYREGHQDGHDAQDDDAAYSSGLLRARLMACAAPSAGDPWGHMHIKIYYYGQLQAELLTATGQGIRLSSKPTNKAGHHVCVLDGPLQAWFPPIPQTTESSVVQRLEDALKWLVDGIIFCSTSRGIMFTITGGPNVWFQGNTVEPYSLPHRAYTGMHVWAFDTDRYLLDMARSPSPRDTGPPAAFVKLWVSGCSLGEERNSSRAPLSIIVYQTEIYRHFE
ncbi:R10 [Macaca mulatta rhadinovirus 17577]|uniref:VIRF n=2 Tax=Macacine gammaherpesvirus 5 TaxID=154334 RepID=Q77NI3_9GAMA|nr:R10 [Macacine gammaherpesvirus 5]AAD21388.1 R10 [Macaca mulatta rhadinovirus 17577]AAF60040.1 vIRF [Rhesus monkey rhadinovirus H26-95]WUF06354.1 R10 [synthetic construct]WVG99663.1 R10 [Macaca mulatta rhadinovirus]QFN51672.1 ORF R10 [Macacine gammaherpesvirus 5]